MAITSYVDRDGLLHMKFDSPQEAMEYEIERMKLLGAPHAAPDPHAAPAAPPESEKPAEAAVAALKSTQANLGFQPEAEKRVVLQFMGHDLAYRRRMVVLTLLVLARGTPINHEALMRKLYVESTINASSSSLANRRA